MTKVKGKDLLIGAHCSGAGGLYNALLEGVEIGATTIQLFTANQRTWQPKELTQEVIDQWHITLKESGLRDIMSHDSYLINLGAPNLANLIKSRHAFAQEIERCLALDIRYLNFHPGAAIDHPIEQCLDRIAESLLQVAPLLEKGNLRLLLETTAGQGSTVGWKFEELAYIIDQVEAKLPVGVCFDTCHSFCAGYDLRTAEALDATLDEFDRVIGLKQLYAFHVNDSMRPFGSRKDRHACLGDGEIGLEAFRCLMQNKRTRALPKYLETPEGEARWKEEITMLRRFADE